MNRSPLQLYQISFTYPLLALLAIPLQFMCIITITSIPNPDLTLTCTQHVLGCVLCVVCGVWCVVLWKQNGNKRQGSRLAW